MTSHVDGSSSAHVDVRGLVKVYATGGHDVVALAGLDLQVGRGEVVAIVGASGSGKSTLVDILAGLQEPTAGSVRVGGTELARMDEAERAHYRRHVVAFVWQQTSRNLLPYLDARANVEVPLALVGWSRRNRRVRVMELLDMVGVADRAGHRPAELSGGEQQRVAIATALATQPELLLADEPTGELDTTTATEVLATLRTTSRDLGTTVLVVTHDPLVSGSVERAVALRDGRTVTEVRRRRIDGTVDWREEEFAVVDRGGWVQLPDEDRRDLGIGRRARLHRGVERIEVFSDPAEQEGPDAVGEDPSPDGLGEDPSPDPGGGHDG